MKKLFTYAIEGREISCGRYTIRKTSEYTATPEWFENKTFLQTVDHLDHKSKGNAQNEKIGGPFTGPSALANTFVLESKFWK